MALRVAQSMRLDILGIDLLIPDISASWKENKCGICEINAQPQISGDKHKFILEKILKSKGRIPVILCFGEFNEFKIYHKALAWTSSKRLNLGFANNESAYINEKKILEGFSDINQTGMSMIMNSTVDFLILEVNLKSQYHPVFPVDKVDAIFIPQNISELLNDSKKGAGIKEIFKFSKSLISFVGEAAEISKKLKLPGELVKNFKPDAVEVIFNKLIGK